MGIAELSHRPTPSYPRFHLAFPVTDRATWDALAERFRAAVMKFVIGNALEFKAFADINQLFATG